LPEGLGETEHHEAEDDAEGAEQEEEAEVPSVVDGTGYAADGENEEGLDGADPGYVGACFDE